MFHLPDSSSRRRMRWRLKRSRATLSAVAAQVGFRKSWKRRADEPQARARRATRQISVQPPSQKYSGSLLTQITSTSIAIPHPQEGRIAIVTDVGRGMRWTQAALLTRAHSCGRRSRVVLTPRRWRQVGGSDSAGDGGNQARSPGRARNKLLKPLRREGRVFRRTCGD
jgi:hypothetical protein